MLTVIGFCHKDRDAALRLVRFIGKLGGAKGHRLLLSFTQSVNASNGQLELIEAAKPLFDEVLTHCCYDEDERPWPMSCNHLWQRTVYYIAQTPREPWLWIEPDAVPLKAGWLDAIETAYQEANTPFMGGDVDTTYCKRHMSGIAVYPADVGRYTDKLYMLNEEAWDTYFCKEFMESGSFTPLIQHMFWTNDDQKTQPTFPNEQSLAIIDPRAVIFHRNKDHSLMDRLLNKPPVAAPLQISRPTMDLQAIYTYYEPVGNINQGEQMALIQLWSQKWIEAGWEPIVLSESDARQHPRFKEAHAIFSTFPTSNPEGYDLACFMRWLAVAQMGGGWMCDYDVMPNRPDALWAVSHFFSGNARDHLIPCLVHGDTDWFNRMVSFFLTTLPSGNHWSDMVALRLYRDDCDLQVKEYGEYGWQYASAIHFSHHSLNGKEPRSQHIPALLPRSDLAGPQEAQDTPAPTSASLSAKLEPKQAISALVKQLRTAVDGRKGFRLHCKAELKRAGLL